MTPITLHPKPGMPPDGADGLFLGWGADGWPWLLWWNKEAGIWRKITKSDRSEGTVESAGLSMAGVIAHAQLPEPARGRK